MGLRATLNARMKPAFVRLLHLLEDRERLPERPHQRQKLYFAVTPKLRGLP